MKFEQYKLQNGANIVLVPHDTKSVTTLVMYPLGSRYEPEKLSGVSHYIEHLMFKGTKKRKNTLVLTREIDRLGAEYNAFTGKEYTGYYIKVDAAYTETAVDILSDMLVHSVFDPKEMEREKGPIIEELKMYRDNPLINIDNIFEDLLYHGCPLGRDIGGTDDHVRSFKRPDVLAFKKKYYDISNATIVLAGAVDEKTKKIIQKYFGKTKKKHKPSRNFKKFVFGPAAKEKRIVVQKKQADQAQLMLGFPGFAYGDRRNAIMTVLNTILGGSMSSRLFIQVRERHGLAYTVRSGAERFRDTGYAYIRAGVDPKNINKVIALVQKEIKKLITKGVTKRELEDAKTHIRGALTLSLEDSSVQANWYASQALFQKKMGHPEKKLKKVDAVTREQVQRLAKQVFKPSQMRVAIIGNVDKKSIRF